MAYVEGSIVIGVTPEVILAALEDVAHAVEWTPSLQKIWDIKGKGAGCTYRWRYKLGPTSFEGNTHIIESTLQRFVMNTEGGVPSSWTWTMTPVQGGTKVKVGIEYSVPGSFLGALVDKLIVEKQNERDMRSTLAALKTRLEKK